jgi:hypothetical protein
MNRFILFTLGLVSFQSCTTSNIQNKTEGKAEIIRCGIYPYVNDNSVQNINGIRQYQYRSLIKSTNEITKTPFITFGTDWIYRSKKINKIEYYLILFIGNKSENTIVDQYKKIKYKEKPNIIINESITITSRFFRKFVIASSSSTRELRAYDLVADQAS